MNKYCVNKHAQPNGDHEVHKEGCKFFPSEKIDLGTFSDCKDAVTEAKKYYSVTNGCLTCCSSCHTR